MSSKFAHNQPSQEKLKSKRRKRKSTKLEQENTRIRKGSRSSVDLQSRNIIEMKTNLKTKVITRSNSNKKHRYIKSIGQVDMSLLKDREHNSYHTFHCMQDYEQKSEEGPYSRRHTLPANLNFYYLHEIYQRLFHTLQKRQKNVNQMKKKIENNLDLMINISPTQQKILSDINKKIYNDEMNLLTEWLHKPFEELKEYIEDLEETEQELERRFNKQTYEEIRSEYELNTNMVQVMRMNKRRLIERYNRIKHLADLNLAKEIYQDDFQKLLNRIQEKLKRREIVDAKCTGVQVKNLRRTFHKVYYDYNGDASKLTDVLRTSFIFNRFRDMFSAILIIYELVDILRYKNTFDKDYIPGGWRQILLNIRCPNTPVICEIQLHISNLEEYYASTHDIYRIRRLFQHPKGNYFDQFAQQMRFKRNSSTRSSLSLLNF